MDKRVVRSAALEHISKTVPGKGWFPLIRFYGPLAPLFDKSWKPDDIVLESGSGKAAAAH